MNVQSLVERLEAEKEPINPNMKPSYNNAVQAWNGGINKAIALIQQWASDPAVVEAVANKLWETTSDNAPALRDEDYIKAAKAALSVVTGGVE